MSTKKVEKLIEKSEAQQAAEMIEYCNKVLVWTDSENRLDTMLRLIAFNPRVSDNVAWTVFHEWWPSCDATWPFREVLKEFIAFRTESDSMDYLGADDRALFDALPERVRIYRGCSRARVRGFAWSTSREVAEKFARGHRYITVPDPVVAEVTIPKRLISGFYNGRNEFEVFIDPEFLVGNKTLKVSPYVGEQMVRPFASWATPDTKTLKREWKVEVEMKGLSWLMEKYPTPEAFAAGVKAAPELEVTPEIHGTIIGATRHSDKASLIHLLKTYASWPKYRNEKAVEAIYEGFRQGNEMKMPILVRHHGKLRVLAGNTRMDIAAQLGLMIEAKVLEVELAS